MNHKIFVGVFIGLLAINISIQTPTLKNDALKNILVVVLDEAINISTIILDKADSAVETFAKNEDSFKKLIVAEGVVLGKQVNQLILKAIDELADRASADGKAVIKCIHGEQAKTEAAMTKIFEDIGLCAYGENDKVIPEVTKIIKQVRQVIDDLKAPTQKLKECSSEEMVCLLGFLGDTYNTIESIPKIAQSDLEDIINLAKTISGDVEGCAGDIIKGVKSAAQEIFNEGVACFKS